MASLAKSFWEYGTFERHIAWHAVSRKQELVYGPVFFFLASEWFDLFGFSLLSYRAWVLFTGFFAMVATLLVWQTARPPKKHLLVMALFLLADPFWFRALHEGRNDLLAMAWALLAWWALMRAAAYGHGRSKPGGLLLFWLLSGIFYAAALLTTPRIGFTLPAFLIVLLVQSARSGVYGTLLGIIMWTLPSLVTYTFWILLAFGGWQSFWSLYADLATAFTKVGHRSYFLQPLMLPLMGITSILVGYSIYRFGKVFWDNQSLLACFWILGFYAIVHDKGPYAIFTLPAYYVLLFRSIMMLEVIGKEG